MPLTVLGSGAVYTVTVDGLAGHGTIGLNLTDDGSIHDADLEGTELNTRATR